MFQFMTEKITSAEEMEKEFTSKESSNQQDSMKAYMNAISGFPLVSIEEEKQLSRWIHGKDKKKSESASNTLIQANLRLVVKIAHDFTGSGLPLVDLISEGNIGLMKAVRKFDPSKGAKFSSYAAWWIKQCMRRAISNQTQTIRIPIQTGSKMSKIKRMRGILKIELEREPTDFELACAVNLSERTVNTLRNSESSVFSLNDPLQVGEEGDFEEIIPDKNAKSPEALLGDSDSNERLYEAINILDTRERLILEMRYFQNKTLEEVSRIVGRTRERVRQIQNQALDKLKILMEDEAEAVNI